VRLPHTRRWFIDLESVVRAVYEADKERGPPSLSPAITKYKALLQSDDCVVHGVAQLVRMTALSKITSSIECWCCQEDTSERTEALLGEPLVQSACT